MVERMARDLEIRVRVPVQVQIIILESDKVLNEVKSQQ